jgi:hypothetical protein
LENYYGDKTPFKLPAAGGASMKTKLFKVFSALISLSVINLSYVSAQSVSKGTEQNLADKNEYALPRSKAEIAEFVSQILLDEFNWGIDDNQVYDKFIRVHLTQIGKNDLTGDPLYMGTATYLYPDSNPGGSDAEVFESFEADIDIWVTYKVGISVFYGFDPEKVWEEIENVDFVNLEEVFYGIDDYMSYEYWK